MARPGDHGCPFAGIHVDDMDAGSDVPGVGEDPESGFDIGHVWMSLWVIAYLGFSSLGQLFDGEVDQQSVFGVETDQGAELTGFLQHLEHGIVLQAKTGVGCISV